MRYGFQPGCVWIAVFPSEERQARRANSVEIELTLNSDPLEIAHGSRLEIYVMYDKTLFCPILERLDYAESECGRRQRFGKVGEDVGYVFRLLRHRYGRMPASEQICIAEQAM